MQKKRRNAVVVGFYKEHGKTKPITKSVAQLNRKKVVESPHGFHVVVPESKRASISERLERTMEDLTCVSNNVELLREQRQELLAHGSSTDSVDRQIALAERQLAMLKNNLRHLGR